MTIDLDEMLEKSRAKWWYSYSFVFGVYRWANGQPHVVIVVDVYHTKFECEQRKFEAESFHEAFEKLKFWLENPGVPVQVANATDLKKTKHPMVV